MNKDRLATILEGVAALLGIAQQRAGGPLRQTTGSIAMEFWKSS